jgi:calcium-activated chloride channel regulator 4
LVDNKTEGSVGKPSVQHFILDASLGRDLFIVIEFEHKEFEVKVSSPSGTSFNKRTSEEFWCNDNFKTCQFLMAKAEVSGTNITVPALLMPSAWL